MDGTDISQIALQPQFVVVPLIFVGLSALAIIIGIFTLVYVRAKESGTGSTSSETGFGGITASIIVAVLAAIMGISWIFIPIPYNSKYWPIYQVTGQVQSISNGFSDGSGDSTVRVYVVKFKGDDRPYQLDDARVTTLRGEKISLACYVNWVNFGYSADRWDCDIRSADYTSKNDF